MRYYKVFSTGCKVSQYESQQARSLLEAYGLQEADSGDPDICVVNTCAVTSSAAGKSRRLIRSLARRYPHCKLAVLGCYATAAQHEAGQLPGVTLVAEHQEGILRVLDAYLNTLATSQLPHYRTKRRLPQGNLSVKGNFAEYTVDDFGGRHRAILKIQDGCDARCTYCSIPLYRPELSWSPVGCVLDQARRFLDAGHKEIVLSGVFLGAYGRSTAKKSRWEDARQPLVEVIEGLLALPGLGRLRLSSLEPGDLTDELARVLCDSEAAAGHVHLPLQHGSDAILRRMGRQYRVNEYYEAASRARSALGDLAITTDVIVGFPGETEADFEASLGVARDIGFAKMHIFPFSAREGTAAWEWVDEAVGGQVLKDRLDRIHALEHELAVGYRRRFVGKTVRVLVERVERNGKMTYCRGRADEYFEVRFAGSAALDNEIVKVAVTGVDNETLVVDGEIGVC